MDWLDLLAVQGTLKSLLHHHNVTTSILQLSAFFMVQISHPHLTTGKTLALTIWNFVGKVMPLLFNMLSRFVIVFFPRRKCLLMSLSAVTLEAKKIKSVTVSFFPFYLPRREGTGRQGSLFTLLVHPHQETLVPSHFLPLELYHPPIWGHWYFSWQPWFQLGIHYN